MIGSIEAMVQTELGNSASLQHQQNRIRGH
jgi:hypothetical protein